MQWDLMSEVVHSVLVLREDDCFRSLPQQFSKGVIQQPGQFTVVRGGDSLRLVQYCLNHLVLGLERGLVADHYLIQPYPCFFLIKSLPCIIIEDHGPRFLFLYRKFIVDSGHSVQLGIDHLQTILQ